MLSPVMRSTSVPSLPSSHYQANNIEALNTMLRWVLGCADLVSACRAIASVWSDDQSQPLFKLDLVGLLLASYLDRRDSQDDVQHHSELHFDVGLCLLAMVEQELTTIFGGCLGQGQKPECVGHVLVCRQCIELCVLVIKSI
jgi:hypothetical protein